MFDLEFLERAKKITEGYDKECGSWSQDSQLLHIITEVTEVKDVLRNKNDKYGATYSEVYIEKLHDEIADVFLTGISLVNITIDQTMKPITVAPDNKSLKSSIPAILNNWLDALPL